MALLAAPLEQHDLHRLRVIFPEFTGDVPEEARYWSRQDVELFFGSGGQLRPREVVSDDGATCTFLSRVRLALADAQVEEATAEYKSLCRHLSEAERAEALPNVAACCPIPRQKAAPPGTVRSPLVLATPPDAPHRSWDLRFWCGRQGDEQWVCRSRCPPFEADARGQAHDRVEVAGTVAEFAEYAALVEKMDGGCAADNALAFPRVALDGWTPFLSGAKDLFETHWRHLMPAGLRDLTPRWVRLLASAFNMDWREFLARFFRVTVAPPGAVGRLRVENNGAHVWHTQTQGRRLFAAFSPKDAAAGRLYAERGSACEGPAGYTARASPVDVLRGARRKHPDFAAATAHVAVLRPGETVVIPSGWWYYSAALETSVTIAHQFWDSQNRSWIIDEFRENFDPEKMPPELQEMAASTLQKMEATIAEDSDSEMEL